MTEVVYMLWISTFPEDDKDHKRDRRLEKVFKHKKDAEIAKKEREDWELNVAKRTGCTFWSIEKWELEF